MVMRALLGAGTPKELAAQGAGLLWLLDPERGLLVILSCRPTPGQNPLPQRAVDARLRSRDRTQSGSDRTQPANADRRIGLPNFPTGGHAAIFRCRVAAARCVVEAVGLAFVPIEW
jgi:hypothetical protein